MMSMLSSLGSKLVEFIADPFVTYDRQSRFQDLVLSDVISKHLHFESYDSKQELFLNMHSAGFVIEAVPLVGGDDTVASIFDFIFEETMQEGASIQCLLWADHRVDPFLKGWGRSMRQDEIYAEIAKQRAAHYLSSPRISPRMFRFIISYSAPYDKAKDLESLAQTKDKILSAIRSLTPASLWKPQSLLQAVGGILNLKSIVPL